MFPAITDLKTKFRWTTSYIQRILSEMILDLWAYYITPYPFLLMIGAIRRIMRRLKTIWLPKPKGRPPIHENIVDLIVDMKRCNRIWGAQRISDELALLGIKVSKNTVLKILRMAGFIPPKTRFEPPSWSSLLNTLPRYWAIDFTCVFDAKNIQIFILAIIEVPSRRLVLINSTPNPTRDWLIHQLRNTGFSNVFPQAILHDRDGIYGHWLPKVLLEFGAASVKTPPRCPWHNAHVERFHGSLKCEVLDRVPLNNNEQVRELCLQYQNFYNEGRPHQGIGGQTPNTKIVEDVAIDPEELKIEKTDITDF